MRTDQHHNLVQLLSLLGLVGIGVMFGVLATADPVPSEMLIVEATHDASRSDSRVNLLDVQHSLFAQEEIDALAPLPPDASLHTFTHLVTENGLVDVFDSNRYITIFAPTDAAFQRLPQTFVNTLERDPDLLRRVLEYHIVVGYEQLLSADVETATVVQTLDRHPVNIDRRNGYLFINQAKVMDTDIHASNGVIHPINRVLLPPDIQAEFGL